MHHAIMLKSLRNDEIMSINYPNRVSFTQVNHLTQYNPIELFM